jgi:hypothetical protein
MFGTVYRGGTSDNPIAVCAPSLRTEPAHTLFIPPHFWSLVPSVTSRTSNHLVWLNDAQRNIHDVYSNIFLRIFTTVRNMNAEYGQFSSLASFFSCLVPITPRFSLLLHLFLHLFSFFFISFALLVLISSYPISSSP